ncbi:MAG: HAD-IIIA family hydrolase [Burkholderiaceae bacterium]
MTANAPPPTTAADAAASDAARLPALRAEALARARAIRLVAFDVDGTMTDGAIHIGPDGEAFKRFSVRDGLGIVLLHRAGLRTAIVTGRESAIVAQRARELSIPHVIQGVKDKHAALRQLCRDTGLETTQIAFVGDDWPDLPAMVHAGLAAAVVNAAPEVRRIAHYVGTAAPGDGAVREFCEWLLDAQQRREALLARFHEQGERPDDAPPPDDPHPTVGGTPIR